MAQRQGDVKWIRVTTFTDFEPQFVYISKSNNSEL
jgi:hypothetical protein